MSPNEHANLAYTIADNLVRDVIRYAASPTEQSDRDRNLSTLIATGKNLLLVLKEASSHRASGTYATPNNILLHAIEAVDIYATDALVRTDGLSIQAAQVDLRYNLRSARGND